MSGPATQQMGRRPKNTSVSDFPLNEEFARVALTAFGISISDNNDFISDLEVWLTSNSKDWKFRLSLFAWRFDTSLPPSVTMKMISCISETEPRREALIAAWKESKYSYKNDHVFEHIDAFISTFERILKSFQNGVFGQKFDDEDSLEAWLDNFNIV